MELLLPGGCAESLGRTSWLDRTLSIGAGEASRQNGARVLLGDTERHHRPGVKRDGGSKERTDSADQEHGVRLSEQGTVPHGDPVSPGRTQSYAQDLVKLRNLTHTGAGRAGKLSAPSKGYFR